MYDAKTETWRRLVESPLFSGGGKMNAYFVGPVQDKSGVFHICWVWRNTPDCATNHDLCYARSKDLVRWETSAGRPLSLPITLATAEVVDPVPPGGGMINGNTKLGFDAESRPVISYHKFDAQGKTQLYNARREDGGWRIYQTSDWDYRWEFQGGGTIRFEIGFGPVVTGPDGSLTQTWQHVKHGSGNWKLDPQTLKPIGKCATPQRASEELLSRRVGVAGHGSAHGCGSGTGRRLESPLPASLGNTPVEPRPAAARATSAANAVAAVRDSRAMTRTIPARAYGFPAGDGSVSAVRERSRSEIRSSLACGAFQPRGV